MQERVQDVERRSAKEATAYDEVDVVVAALDAGRRTRREQQSREARAELERQQQLRNSQGDDRRGGGTDHVEEARTHCQSAKEIVSRARGTLIDGSISLVLVSFALELVVSAYVGISLVLKFEHMRFSLERT
ncbi:hypothetical protein PC113_g12434 [Phytophthora cactorum]|uniref:Uncharacterized protein n=1 Tax=Phytophthora cactorum TaxID=29920 RepID=A0A8T0Z0J0_9STRA|nr:hypothetical protein PC113_g12434 [Phytophthora cactorum]